MLRRKTSRISRLARFRCDRAAELLRRGDAQPADRAAVRQDEQRAVAAVNSDAPLVNLLELGAAANPLVRAGTRERNWLYSLLTVRRLRPFARRRFSTSRPFLVLIRTRNPCVFSRWRVFG